MRYILSIVHIILNHRLVQAENAHIAINDRGFRYGDGAFETIAVHQGVPYRFDWHRERLARALAAIRISASVDFIKEECRTLLRANAVKDGLLRIQITRGAGGRGYLPEPSTPTCVIETLPPVEPPHEPVTLFTSSYQKISARALPIEKLCQGLNSTLARMEAADHNCFDAVMLNAEGHIAETSSATLFWQKNGRLFTPSLACGALPGAMRAAIMALSESPVEETQATPADLADADAVCIANVAWKILAVKELIPSGLTWDSKGMASRLRGFILQDVEKEVHNQRHYWQNVEPNLVIRATGDG